MSKKNELINILSGYKAKYEEVQGQVSAINQNNLYTEQGKEEAVNNLVSGFSGTAQQFHDKAASIIDSALENITGKKSTASANKLTDAGYQMGLSNIIKMLELDVIQTREDMAGIIDIYKDDVNALAIISSLLKKSSHGIEFFDLIPVDNREYSSKLLNQLKENIDKYMNAETLQGSTKAWNGFNQNNSAGVLLSLDSMLEFITNRLNDNLEVVA